MFLFDFVCVNIWKFNQTDTDRLLLRQCHLSFNSKANSCAYWKNFASSMLASRAQKSNKLRFWVVERARLFFSFDCSLANSNKRNTPKYIKRWVFSMGTWILMILLFFSFLSSSICRFSPSTYMKIKSILIKYIDKS